MVAAMMTYPEKKKGMYTQIGLPKYILYEFIHLEGDVLIGLVKNHDRRESNGSWTDLYGLATIHL